MTDSPPRPSQTHPLTPFSLSPLLMPNVASEARDYAAQERTFLSWLRLSMYLSVVSVAIILSFHLQSAPSTTERTLALPVGALFVVMSVACLASGVGNYVGMVRGYVKARALVQTGVGTQVVGWWFCMCSRGCVVGFDV